MTTHRNLKPHYAEPKGKSGPVIVVKKGEVMSEPTTEAGKALRDEQDNIALVAVHPHAAYMTACWLCERIIAIEQEARANADRELREALEWALDTIQNRDDYLRDYPLYKSARALLSRTSEQ